MARIPTATRIIVLIDGENFPAKCAEQMLADVSKLGSVVEARVYGHYDEKTMSSWREKCSELGLIAVDVPATGPNSADFHLTIEAIDLLHTRKLDAFCIAASDVGYSSLVRRLKGAKLRVYGFGVMKKGPAFKEYRREFDQFEVVGETKKKNEVPPKRAAPAAKDPTPAPKQPPKSRSKPPSNPPAKLQLPVDAMLATIVRLQSPDGWTHLAEFGKHYRPKAYGYAMLTKLVSEGLKDYVEVNPHAPNKIRQRIA